MIEADGVSVSPGAALEEPRQHERKLQRLQHLLMLYRLSLGAALLVIAVLTVLLFFGKSPRFGRAIIVNGQTVVMVRDAKAATAVRARLLAEVGGGEGATIKEKWEDAPRQAEGAQILSVGEAVKRLKPRVTVLCEAVAIEADGVPLVVVPSKDFAQRILDQLKARYASLSDAVVTRTSLLPTPAVRPCTALPADIISDEQQAVARLASSHGTPQRLLVRAGDNPDSLSSQNGMTLASFWRLNPGCRGRDLRVGEPVSVLGRSGLTVVTVKEMVSTQVIPPPVTREKATDLPRGQKKILQPGKAGARRVRWEVTMHDEREVSRRSLTEEITVQPEPQEILIGVGNAGG